MSIHQDLFNDIAKFIEDSRVLLAEGVELELDGLDRQVQTLCAKVLLLSPLEREKYADLLQELLGELKILGDDLLLRKEALTHEIRFLSSHKMANLAYKSADSKANPDDLNSGDCD